MKVITNIIEYAGLRKAIKKHIDITDMSKKYGLKIQSSIYLFL